MHWFSSAVVLAASLLTCIAPARLAAQSDSVSLAGVHRGEHVRVTAPATGPWLTGRVLRLGRDTLLLWDRSGQRVPIHVSNIARLEVQRGRNHPAGALRGFGMGAVIGGSLAAATALFADPENCHGDICLSRGELGVFRFVVGGAIGAGWGALMGGLSGTPRWQTLSEASSTTGAGNQRDSVLAAVPPSSQVRVFATHAETRPLTGRVDLISQDTVVVSTHGMHLSSFALSQIDSLQVSRGKRHAAAAWAGLFVGAAAGSIILGGVGYVDDKLDESSGEGVPAAAGGAPFGATIGASVLGIRGFERREAVWPRASTR